MVEKVSFQVFLKDSMSSGLAKVARVGNATFNQLNAKQNSFQAETIQSGGAVEGLNVKMKGLNATSSLLGRTLKTAMAGFGVFMVFSELGKSLDLFNTQAQAEAQVMAGLKSTNNAVGLTFQDLAKQAAALQKKTLFGDEVTLQAQSVLLTFKQIRGEMFTKTVPILQDIATKLKINLSSAAMQFGKALNDPKTGLSMLTRVGVTFSDKQKAVIKSLQKTGNLAGAQAVILKELKSEFGNAAEAARKAGTGGITALKNRLGDALEKLGKFVNVIIEGLMPVIDALVSGLSKVFLWLNKYKSVLVPIITGLGIVIGLYGLWTAAQWALNAAMIANPIGIVIVAIGALIGGIIWAWNKFEGFRKVVLGLWGVVKLVFGWIKTYIMFEIKLIMWPIKQLWNLLKIVGKFLKDVFWGTFKSVFSWIGDKIAKTFSFFWKLLKPVLKLLGVGEIVKGVVKVYDQGAALAKVKDNQSSTAKAISFKGFGNTGTGSAVIPAAATSSGSVIGAVSGAGKSAVRNVTISINNLIDKFEINTTNIQESLEDIKEKVSEVLLEAVNDANLATG
jgi:hypothetical protein